MAEPEVSVVIPAYDRTPALRNNLRSLGRQTLDRDAFEVIVVDDGSPVAVAGQLAGLAGGVRPTVIRHERPLGAATARNTGASAARGRLLVFLDADCLCHPGLLQAHVDTQAGGPVGVCGYAGGRELTPAAWRLILGEDWDFADIDATFARLAGTPVLHDPLAELLARPRPADWAFFWTLNASVPKQDFDRVGGFDQSFEVKGCEDMELGYRLARAGLPTVFAREAISIHQPHERDRNTEVVRDRRNERILVREYPTVEVEAVCSYDIIRARELVPVIERFAGRVVAATSDCARLGELPGLTARLAESGPVLLAGSPQGWPAGQRPPSAVCYPGPVPDAGAVRHLPLLGTRLPDAGHRFALGVLTDYWRLFPERTVSRILAELHRICQDVLMLSGVSTAPAERPDQELAEALSANDHPYWEFTVPLRRELHQFGLAEWETNGRGQAAFSCSPLAWPRTDLIEID